MTSLRDTMRADIVYTILYTLQARNARSTMFVYLMYVCLLLVSMCCMLRMKVVKQLKEDVCGWCHEAGNGLLLYGVGNKNESGIMRRRAICILLVMTDKSQPEVCLSKSATNADKPFTCFTYIFFRLDENVKTNNQFCAEYAADCCWGWWWWWCAFRYAAVWTRSGLRDWRQMMMMVLYSTAITVGWWRYYVRHKNVGWSVLERVYMCMWFLIGNSGAWKERIKVISVTSTLG